MAGAGRAVPLCAYVLHSHEWSESSLIVEVLTRERGRLAVVAKGARRPYSQLRSLLLPFQRVGITLARKSAQEPSDLFTLRQAEWQGGQPPLSGAALFAGFYLNELLMRSLARLDPHPEVFDAYAWTLPALAGADDLRAQAGLRAFELTLLRMTGVLPDLSVLTATQQPLSADLKYLLRPELGVVSLSSGQDEPGALAGSLLVALEHALGQGLLAPVQQLCRQSPASLRHGLRMLLQHQLGSAPLRTRQVVQGMQRLFETQPVGAP